MRVLVGQPPLPDLGRGGSIVIGHLSEQEFGDLCRGLREVEAITTAMADDSCCGDCGKWAPIPRLVENVIRDLTEALQSLELSGAFRPPVTQARAAVVESYTRTRLRHGGPNWKPGEKASA